MKKIQLILSVFIAAVMITSCSKDEPIVLSSLKGIDSFEIAFDGVDAKDVQTEKKGENITISVPFKTSLTGLKPTIKVSDKATVSPASGKAIDFTDGVAKQFTITAEDKTTKVYNVTINVRGEVGSGSKLKTFRSNDSWGADVLTTYTYAESNFVKEYSEKVGKNTTVYAFVYDAKNQITEKKCDDKKESTIYTYNDKGQITGATLKTDGKLTYTYKYTYDTTGNLTEEVRVTEADKKEAIKKFEYKNGNVVKENRYNQPYVATYDDKNNPFIGIYPSAYSKINTGIGIKGINKNNPITMTGADAAITYTYNNDNYPLTSSYGYFGAATVNCTYTYQ